VPLLAGASALLMPVNRSVGRAFYYGDPFTDREFGRLFGMAAPQMYTSGLFAGHLGAFLLGGVVVARERRYCWTKPVVAAVAGLVLAVVQTAVAVPLAAAQLRADPLAHYVAEPTMLGSAMVWRPVVIGFFAYPLWAVIGLGAGLIVRRRAVLTGAALIVPVMLLCTTTGLPVQYLAHDQVGPHAAISLPGLLAGLAALSNRSRSASVLDGAICSWGTTSPVVGSRHWTRL
jgi:hypothetical protein